MLSNKKCNQVIQINSVITELNNLYYKFEKCKLTKDKHFSSIPEYVLFTVFSYCNLEIACNGLKQIINKMIIESSDDILNQIQDQIYSHCDSLCSNGDVVKKIDIE